MGGVWLWRLVVSCVWCRMGSDWLMGVFGIILGVDVNLLWIIG